VAARADCQHVFETVKIVSRLAVALVVTVQSLSPVAPFASEIRSDIRSQSSIFPARVTPEKIFVVFVFVHSVSRYGDSEKIFKNIKGNGETYENTCAVTLL
jgi:hypothetical protein